jgi:hypothetical protein
MTWAFRTARNFLLQIFNTASIMTHAMNQITCRITQNFLLTPVRIEAHQRCQSHLPNSEQQPASHLPDHFSRHYPQAMPSSLKISLSQITYVQTVLCKGQWRRRDSSTWRKDDKRYWSQSFQFYGLCTAHSPSQFRKTRAVTQFIRKYQKSNVNSSPRKHHAAVS